MSDVKSTLSTIAMSADIVLKRLEANSPARHHLDGLKQAALRGAEAVGQLVAMSKADAHHPSGFRRIGGDRIASLNNLPEDLVLIVVAAEPMEGKIAAQYFRTLGFDARAVADTYEALEGLRLNVDRPVVVLVDATLGRLAEAEFDAAARGIAAEVRTVSTAIRSERRGSGDLHEVDFEGLQHAVAEALELPAQQSV
jgi:hypothetical protein